MSEDEKTIQRVIDYVDAQLVAIKYDARGYLDMLAKIATKIDEYRTRRQDEFGIETVIDTNRLTDDHAMGYGVKYKNCKLGSVPIWYWQTFMISSQSLKWPDLRQYATERICKDAREREQTAKLSGRTSNDERQPSNSDK